MEDEDEFPTIYEFAGLSADRARYWLAMDGWTVDEAAHLLCGIGPTPELLGQWAQYAGSGAPWDWAAANSYENAHKARRVLLQRAGEAGALTFPTPPADVIEWAMKKGLRLPALLISDGAVVRADRWTDLATKASESLTKPAPAAATSATHKTKRRAMPLAAVLAESKRQALDATDWPSVWDALVRLAQSGTRPAPLLGYVEGEGVKYQSDKPDAPDAYLTRNAFRKRFKYLT